MTENRVVFLTAATSGSAGLCFWVLSSKWSFQARPEIKRVSLWLSAERRRKNRKPLSAKLFLMYKWLGVIKKGYQLSSLRFAFSFVWPCWPCMRLKLGEGPSCTEANSLCLDSVFYYTMFIRVYFKIKTINKYYKCSFCCWKIISNQ